VIMLGETDNQPRTEAVTNGHGNGEHNEAVTVVVTGFGPFGVHRVNASWAVVQELKKVGIENVNLVTCEIPVEYRASHQEVPKLWRLHNPKLMVHCGVSGLAREITLETVAHNHGYQSKDVSDKLPCEGCCMDTDSPKQLTSAIDMEDVRQTVSTRGSDVPLVVSCDAGRYLCEFTYYRSLHLCRDAAAFVHVPPLNSPYSVTQLAHTLKLVIEAMLEQLEHQRRVPSAGDRRQPDQLTARLQNLDIGEQNGYIEDSGQ